MENSLGLKSSYARSNLKKKKNCMELEFHTYSGVEGRPIVVFSCNFFNKFDILGSRSLIAAF